jgi:hypothetical protein
MTLEALARDAVASLSLLPVPENRDSEVLDAQGTARMLGISTHAVSVLQRCTGSFRRTSLPCAC